MASERSSDRGAPRAHATTDARCECGNLLARIVAGGVEIKCRRCKRTVVVPVER